MWASGTDDDLSFGGGDTDFDTTVTLLGELTGKELVELGKEYTVCNKLIEIMRMLIICIQILKNCGLRCIMKIFSKYKLVGSVLPPSIYSHKWIHDGYDSVRDRNTDIRIREEHKTNESIHIVRHP